MRRTTGPTPSRRGFTLIELLVVIAVIALLIAILLPALAHARRSARLTKCVVNLHSQGQTLLTYANDFHEAMPPKATMWNRKEEDDQFEMTMWPLARFLSLYEGKPFPRDGEFFPPTAAWRCPEISKDGDAEHFTHFATVHSCAGRFAFNNVMRDDESGDIQISADSIDGWDAANNGWRRLSNFTWPTRLIAMGDALTFYAEVHLHRHALESVGRSWQLVPTDVYQLLGTHGPDWPCVFLDGHASTMKLTESQWLDSTESFRSLDGNSNDFYHAEIDAFLWFVRR